VRDLSEWCRGLGALGLGEQVRWRLLPDLDDELTRAMCQVREMLLTVAAWERWCERPARVPPPLAGRAALAALDRVYSKVAPTQTHGGRAAVVGGRLLSPDRRRFYPPLRLVWPDPTDLGILAGAAAAMGMALATEPHSELAEALSVGADAAGDSHGPAPTPVELVTALAGVHGMLTLAAEPDSLRIAALVTTAGNDDLILPADAEQAYLRTMTRLATMWAPVEGLTC
jgi:hypothetical protein